MMKWLFWILLFSNLVFFALMQWGSALTGESRNLRSQPALNAEKLRLLVDASPVAPATVSPISAVAAVATAQTIPAAPTLPPPPTFAPQAQPESAATCLEWGEFSGVDRKHANASLTTLNLGNILSQRQVEHASGFWVYIPPAKTRAEIDKKIAVLKARGVKDMYVVQEPGKWNNAISLGVFKTADAAHKFVESLRAKGIKTPVVGERQSKLKFTVFVLMQPDAATIEKMTTLRNEFVGSELRSAACN